MSRPLTPEKYFRLPWNLADNAITWLEPTTKCNLYCEGCYRENDPHGHKPLDTVIKDLELVKKVRRTDGISIAGGEPLIYPDLIPLVRYVAAQGWKPIINSNGQALTPELVKDLKQAGVVGFTMHVDSHQVRPGWKGKTEEELCELRLKLASMIREYGEGQIACSFNATIYRDTIKDIPLLTRWAHEHIDIVQTMVYILFRSARRQANFDVYARGKRVDVGDLVYQLDHQENHQDIVSQEIADVIRQDYPEHEPCAFLNGTEDPRSMKWLLTTRVGAKGGPILGYMDAKFMEWVQNIHHYFYDTYLAYSRPCWTEWFQKMLFAAPFNKGLRKLFGRWLKNPADWFKPLYAQSIMVIQPCDLFEDGRQNMCDGCPDAIAYKGKMVWSCRVDELEKFGCFIQCSPRKKEAEAPAVEPAQKAEPAKTEAAKAEAKAPETPAPAPQAKAAQALQTKAVPAPEAKAAASTKAKSKAKAPAKKKPVKKTATSK